MSGVIFYMCKELYQGKPTIHNQYALVLEEKGVGKVGGNRKGKKN